MLNSDRIVPIQKVDLLSLYATVAEMCSLSWDYLAAPDVEGNFVVTGSGSIGSLLLNQPAKTVDFAEGVTAANVYFVAAYDFAGFKIDGAAVTATGAAVVPDGVTLYKAALTGGNAVAITAITPSL